MSKLESLVVNVENKSRRILDNRVVLLGYGTRPGLVTEAIELENGTSCVGVEFETQRF